MVGIERDRPVETAYCIRITQQLEAGEFSGLSLCPLRFLGVHVMNGLSMPVWLVIVLQTLPVEYQGILASLSIWTNRCWIASHDAKIQHEFLLRSIFLRDCL